MAIAAIYKTLFIASLVIGVLPKPQHRLVKVAPKVGLKETPKEQTAALEEDMQIEAEKLAEKQAANAKYKFSATVDDGIMDNMQSRIEERNGYDVIGSYEYSNGFIRQLITYSAGKDGFKILSMETEQLGNGPQENPEGKVNVRTSIDGKDLEYSITKADIGRFKKPAEEAPQA